VPELPDLTVYVEALRERLRATALEGLRLRSAFLLRSTDPPVSAAGGRPVEGVERLGKRIVIALGRAPAGGPPERPCLVLHLMIAGRLHWRERGAPLARRNDLAAFDFGSGSLLLTEAGTKKRASLHLVASAAELRAHDRGGLEPLAVDLAAFRARLAPSRHTLKRALCDQSRLSGIGNAYSDEILHRARLSPLQRSASLSDEAWERLHGAMRAVLAEWTERLRREAAGRFPEKVTAFRAGMAVHGRAGEPCPACAAPIQRIVRAENETNYCPRCQTRGRILRDRALSLLLKDDWPETLEELEEG
jgi:formamidopyrimidine-DNA glycosylase